MKTIDELYTSIDYRIESRIRNADGILKSVQEEIDILENKRSVLNRIKRNYVGLMSMSDLELRMESLPNNVLDEHCDLQQLYLVAAWKSRPKPFVVDENLQIKMYDLQKHGGQIWDSVYVTFGGGLMDFPNVALREGHSESEYKKGFHEQVSEWCKKFRQRKMSESEYEYLINTPVETIYREFVARE